MLNHLNYSLYIENIPELLVGLPESVADLGNIFALHGHIFHWESLVGHRQACSQDIVTVGFHVQVANWWHGSDSECIGSRDLPLVEPLDVSRGNTMGGSNTKGEVYRENLLEVLGYVQNFGH